MAGAAEALSPANAPNHWDVIEGQGSLFHPAYSGVALGLLHGSQPDALVLCHDPSRKALYGFPHVPIVPLDQALGSYLSAARLTNPAARFVGVALNTCAMSEVDSGELVESTSQQLGLPCVDPMRNGVDPIVTLLEQLDEA